MRILCAPDKFKGSLSAAEAANCMRSGIQRVDPAIVVDTCPVADGGEGTIAIISRALADGSVTSFTDKVAGPFGREHPVSASWMVLDNNTNISTAVIELASAAGLALIAKLQQNPMNTTSFGVGELIVRALDSGARTIMVALGGSATCDGGCGLAQALGVRFTLSTGDTLDSTTRAIIGSEVSYINKIDATAIHPALALGQITALCDVCNPLFGQEGAACVYAPQKGADAKEVQQLDRGLTHLARHLLPEADPTIPSSGAAGGAAFGLHAWCYANLQPGFDRIMDIINFDKRLSRADLVITGEGRLDRQSFYGKAVFGIAKRAKALDIPVIAIVGSIDRELMTDDARGLREMLTQWHALDQLPGVRNQEEAILRACELMMECTEALVSRLMSRDE